MDSRGGIWQILWLQCAFALLDSREIKQNDLITPSKGWGRNNWKSTLIFLLFFFCKRLSARSLCLPIPTLPLWGGQVGPSHGRIYDHLPLASIRLRTIHQSLVHDPWNRRGPSQRSKKAGADFDFKLVHVLLVEQQKFHVTIESLLAFLCQSHPSSQGEQSRPRHVGTRETIPSPVTRLGRSRQAFFLAQMHLNHVIPARF